MSEPSRRRLLACADRHAPRGWSIAFGGTHLDDARDGQVLGYADFGSRRLVCPPITDRASLVIALHECGHVNLGHGEDHDDFDVDAEWEAESYAYRAMRACGIPVPRESIENGRAYLRSIYETGKGGAEPSERAMRFMYGAGWRSAGRLTGVGGRGRGLGKRVTGHGRGH